MDTDLHASWLNLEKIMQESHGEKKWSAMRQGMQCAFYMGALTAIRSSQTKEDLWRQCEAGLQDGLKMPSTTRLVVEG